MPSMTAYDRLIEAQRLVNEVCAALDTELIDCPCPEHVRHYRNWDHANMHVQLRAIATKLGAFAHGRAISELYIPG